MVLLRLRPNQQRTIFFTRSYKPIHPPHQRRHPEKFHKLREIRGGEQAFLPGIAALSRCHLPEDEEKLQGGCFGEDERNRYRYSKGKLWQLGQGEKGEQFLDIWP